MIISEIFHTLQGEGFTTGRPAVFVRLGMCNLKCNFCDTPYTWKAGHEDYSDAANEQVCQRVLDMLNQNPRTLIVVWTGGEPLLQQKDIIASIDWLNGMSGRKLEHEIETNGTVPPSKDLDARITRYNCSPKTKMSGNSQYSVKLKDYAHKSIFKYVVGDEAHCEEAIAEIEKNKLPRERCMFMVLGTTREEMIERAPALAEICKREGVALCIRMQCLLWGAIRAV